MLRSRFSLLTCFAYPVVALSLGCGSIDLESTALSGVQSPTFFVSGRNLVDPCGQPVVLRGVNEMVTYMPSKDGLPAFKEIAKTKANSVRIYWHTSDSSRDLDNVLSAAESQDLIAVVYVFNPEPPGSKQPVPTSVAQAVDYWTSTDITNVIKQHEHWLIIALRERSDSNGGSNDNWASDYDAAVARMRSASIDVPLAIDAPNAGSDVDTLLRLGKDRIAADPLQKLLLNVNSGVLGDSADTLASQLAAANSANLPMLVGEISWMTHKSDNSCGDPYTYWKVLAAAQETQTGWLAWSWGARHNVYCPDLDMTNGGSFDNFTDWGRGAAVTDTNSIQNTSQAPSYVPGGACN